MLKQLQDKNSIQQCRLTLQESLKRTSFLQQELDKLTLQPQSRTEKGDRTDRGKTESPFFKKKHSLMKSPKLLAKKGHSEPNLEAPGNNNNLFQATNAAHSTGQMEFPAPLSNQSSSASVFSALLSTFGKKSLSDRSLNTMGGGGALTLDTSDHLPTGIGTILRYEICVD
jgi:hypothetical protein